MSFKHQAGSSGSGGGVMAWPNKEAGVVAEATGMQRWQVLTIAAVLLLAVAALVGWCAWR